MSNKKTESNKKNATLSTGPKDTKITSQNSIKHGMTSAGPNKLDFQSGYNEMLAALTAELRPLGILETLYVQRAALNATRLQRLVRLQAASVDAPPKRAESKRPKGLSPLDLYRSVFPDMDSEGNRFNMEDLRTAIRTLPDVIRQVSPADGSEPKVDMDDLSGLLEKFSTNVARFLGEEEEQELSPAAALAAEVPNSKMLRYETQIENAMYKALHELERVKRLRAGDRSVTAPLAMDITVHADDEDESVS